MMEVGDMLNARHAAAADAQLRQQLQQVSQMDSRSAYAMTTNQGAYNQQQTIQHDSSMAYPSMNPSSHTPQMAADSFMIGPSHSKVSDDMADETESRTNGDAVPKAFSCSTCAKGFARRSDLARHERIHSGVRPHQCEHPGCGKQFIQRSALTVHMRVHTGEKPHMCERCGKPFSDSSSLARHRRIHSGKRPYKCPWANCQKTFTRRTTLTRHQNHHPGTIEQARAETAAKLSNTQQQSVQQQDGDFSDNESSQNSTDSPTQRTMSMSPSHDLPPIPNMHRQNSDYGYMPQNSTFPPHLRSDFPSNPPRSSPAMNSSSLVNYTSAPQQRPPMTSHPNPYGPPQPLEPPANGTASGSGSPHLTALGWGSPTHGNMPSPGTLESYAYPDPTYGGSHSLYYPGSNIRRPQSTEPEDYGLRPRGSHAQNNNNLNSLTHNHMGHGGLNSHHHMQGSVPMTADWSSIPVKEERFVL